MRCKHEKLEYRDTISATTSICIEEFGEGEVLSCTSEYGNRLKDEVVCLVCSKKWTVNGREPMFVTKFVEKINSMLG